MPEVRVSYGADDQRKVFTLDADIEGMVLVSYELPDVYVNQKRFIESKDNFIVGNVISRYNCDDAVSQTDVVWRRCPRGLAQCQNDTLVALVGNASFRPCGLVALSMFTDRFELTHLDTMVNISLDERDLALPADRDVFRDKIVPVGRNAVSGLDFSVEGQDSWLQKGALFEHFKVWYRTPPSPFVRNLWATIPGGLLGGRYELRFVENGRMWTESWQVPEKRVVISKAHVLGSPGGCWFIGALCVICACVQVVMTIVFIAAPNVNLE